MEKQAARDVQPKGAEGMRSRVYWTVLGLVIGRPGLYAYKILKRYELEYSAVLPIKSESHIYKALDVLRERGLIRSTPGTELDSERQPKPVYWETSMGVWSYRDWLRAHIDDDRREAGLFARHLAALSTTHPAEGLEIVHCMRQTYLDKATEAVSTNIVRPDRLPGLAGELEAGQRRHMADAKLRWAEELESRLAALSQARTRHPGG